jgi:hypothetical protein
MDPQLFTDPVYGRLKALLTIVIVRALALSGLVAQQVLNEYRHGSRSHRFAL